MDIDETLDRIDAELDSLEFDHHREERKRLVEAIEDLQDVHDVQSGGDRSRKDTERGDRFRVPTP